MHFFVTYEGKRQEIPREITPGLSLPVSYFPSEYQSAFGSTNSTFNEDLFFGKIDLSPTTSDLFEISGQYRKESGEFRSEEHTSELQSLMRISYAVLCLKKKKNNNN